VLQVTRRVEMTTNDNGMISGDHHVWRVGPHDTTGSV
jgi:hypothetical protein